ncbi:hypothetical protein [Paenibacillus sp. Z6-24]
MDLNDYKDMWTIHKDQYALLEVAQNKYAIVDIQNKAAVIIEDSKFSEEVKRQMMKHGNKILDNSWFSNN